MKKQCTVCEYFKDLSEFNKKDTGAYGVYSECKVCIGLRKKDYVKTKSGLLVRIYNHQKYHSKTRNHPPPVYSLKEFRDWALASNVFHDLYHSWFLNDYQKILSPSADRLDDYKPYTLNNLRWVSWQENKDKGYADRKNGVNNKDSKAVNQYSLSGEFIKEFHSGMEAFRKTGIANTSITLCCSGKLKTAGGYRWEFKSKLGSI